ncbi:MAG: FliI/YscN family ATPase [Sulfobacillus sp.]|nr:FliI/YscN family ATPase [Sulfobacillus sp.]
MTLTDRIDRLPANARFRPFGRIEAVRGLTVISRGPDAAIGEVCRLEDSRVAPLALEVVGFLPEGRLLLTPYGELKGVRPGMMITATRHQLKVPVGRSLLGRLIDGTGQPLDNRPLWFSERIEVTREAISPLMRAPITTPLWTGVRVIDALLTLGRGQRLGIFAGAGVGKTTLLQQILRGVTADVAVVGLIGERGREIAEFYHQLPPTARQRTVIVAATSDSPAIMRLRALDTTFQIAETFRQEGQDVILVLDSLTRVALAQSEVGLMGGELPAVRGFTPSVFHLLPRILERAGRFQTGSITGIFTVLLDGDDPTDPIGDAVRGILDGNLYLSRTLAEAHFFPAIDILHSLSRLMPDVVDAAHWTLAGRVRRILATLEKFSDVVALGAYQAGTDPVLDGALAIKPQLDRWARQGLEDNTPPDEALAGLEAIIAAEERLRDI